MSVAEAAHVLGVHPQRIHQRIRDGSLPAEKIGNQWVVQVSDLNRLKRHAGPGRPLSQKSAWDLLALADESSTSGLSPSARSRARSRLRGLLTFAPSADPEDVAAQVLRALGNRARRTLFVASARDLPDIQADRRLQLSGVSLPESNLSAADVAEGYVRAEHVDGLVDDHLLSPAPRARANVILHVIPSAATHPALVDLASVLRSPLAVAADLAEHDGIREQGQVIRSLAALRDRLVDQDGKAEGGRRG